MRRLEEGELSRVVGGTANISVSGNNVYIQVQAYIHGPDNTALDSATVQSIAGSLGKPWNGDTVDSQQSFGGDSYHVTTDVIPVMSPTDGALNITYYSGAVPANADAQHGVDASSIDGRTFTSPVDRTYEYLSSNDLSGQKGDDGYGHEFGHSVGLRIG